MGLKSLILDIVFPRRCLGCEVLLSDESPSYVCRSCLKTIPLAQGFACAFCKSPVKAGKTCVFCAKNYYLDRLLVTASYENPLVEKMVKATKYRFVRSLANDAAGLMARYLKRKAAWLENVGSITVVPVPLHRRRFNWRGFNQAEIMGAGIANYFGWPLVTDALKHVRNRKPQADMPDRASRIQNAQNLFQISGDRKTRDFTDKTVLLIDDLSTTGSTLNDCARALKAAGAKEVIGFVFARGRLDKR